MSDLEQARRFSGNQCRPRVSEPCPLFRIFSLSEKFIDEFMALIPKPAVMFKDKFDFLTREAPDRAKQKVKLLQQLQPAGDFQQLLQRERERAEQTGQEFSLLVFELNEDPVNYEQTQKLWQVIYRRVRVSDLVGWLSNRSLGVILPNTPFAGGHKLMEDIHRLLPSLASFCSYKIFTYPPQEGEGQRA